MYCLRCVATGQYIKYIMNDGKSAWLSSRASKALLFGSLMIAGQFASRLNIKTEIVEVVRQ